MRPFSNNNLERPSEMLDRWNAFEKTLPWWQIKTAFAIRNDHNFIDKWIPYNRFCSLPQIFWVFFYCPLFEPPKRRLKLTRTFDHMFIRFASQCCTIFSIQSKTLVFDAVCPSNSPFLTVHFHMNKQYDWNLINPREFIQGQLVTFAISSESRCAAKALSILNRLIPLPIFHIWWTSALTSVHVLPESPQHSRRRSAATSPLTIHRQRCRFRMIKHF